MNDKQYVGFWARFRASIIDCILIYSLTLPIFYTMYGTELLEKMQIFGTTEGNLGINIFLSFILPFILVLFYWHYKQSTPGKMLLKASIVDADTFEKPSTRQYLVRYIGYFISLLPLGLGYFWAAWDSKKQTWHDKLANTLVIQDKKENNKENNKIGIGTYILRGLGVFSIVIFISLLIFGLFIEQGSIPNQAIYTKKSLDLKVLQNLKDENILMEDDELLYYQPDALFSFTEQGLLFTTNGIVYFETEENGEKSIFEYLYAEHIKEMKFEDNMKILGEDNFTLSIYDYRDELVFSLGISLGTIPLEEFKKEITEQWKEKKGD